MKFSQHPIHTRPSIHRQTKTKAKHRQQKIEDYYQKKCHIYSFCFVRNVRNVKRTKSVHTLSPFSCVTSVIKIESESPLLLSGVFILTFSLYMAPFHFLLCHILPFTVPIQLALNLCHVKGFDFGSFLVLVLTRCQSCC